MAWLSGLADKAENLLNKIDQNTAAVLNKDKCDVPSQFPENQLPRDNSEESTSLSLLYSPSIKLTSKTKATNLVQENMDNENELPPLSNRPTIKGGNSMKKSVNALPTSLSTLKSDSSCSSDSAAELLLQSDFSSPNFSDASIDNKEDKMYLSNIGSVDSKEHLQILPKECTYISVTSETIRPPIEITVDGNKRRKLNEGVENFKDRHVIDEQDTDHQKEISIIKERFASLEIENSQLLSQVVDVQSALEKSRSELSSMRFELEQHRARSLKTLREKEKLIAELKSNTAKNNDDVTIMELNQLRQEREILREENQRLCAQLQLVREELSNTDLTLEKMRQKFIEAGADAQDVITTEKRKRLDAEEDARLHLEELKTLRDEIVRQRNSFTLQLQKQDSEISHLKMQLSTSSTSSSEVESRLATLTQTLVLKQQALEHLTTERNALRLQVEKMEHEYRNYIGNLRRNTSYNNPNDTDDAKAHIPTFLMETPFDTSVTRRVKRAYSSLDAISIRTGVFLRRYPLARILVLIYMALLQFWVLVVLLSQSPEAH